MSEQEQRRRYFGSVTDKQLPDGRFCGQVLELISGNGLDPIADVYANDIKELWQRKRLIENAFEEAHPPQEASNE